MRHFIGLGACKITKLMAPEGHEEDALNLRASDTLNPDYLRSVE